MTQFKSRYNSRQSTADMGHRESLGAEIASHDDSKTFDLLSRLIQLTNRQRFQDRKVHFSSYELIKLLGWNEGAKSYKRIEEALNRWVGVTLYYDKAWWDKSDQCWVNESFHIIESVTIFDKERKAIKKHKSPEDSNAGRSYFVWNQKVFDSFLAGNLKEIDLDIYRELKSATAKRMYRFLDKRFHLKRRIEFDLDTFTYEHVGLSRNLPLNEVKRLLIKPILELESIGFLVPLEKHERFLKIRKGVWKIAFEKGSSDAQTLMSEDESMAFESLKGRGVTVVKASKLARTYSPSKIAEKIAMYDWMVSKKDKRCSSNPTGFLVSAIQNDYPVPTGFLRSAAQAKSELKVVPGNILRRAEVLPKEEVPEEKSHIESEFELWWESISQSEREAFEEKAVETAGAFHKKVYFDSKGKGTQAFRAMQKAICLERFQTLKGSARNVG